MRLLLFFVCYVCFLKIVTTEVICSLNGKAPLHFVSDKFLSSSVDLAVFVRGLNESILTRGLAKYLNPVYLRIVDSSSDHIQFRQDSNELVSKMSDKVHKWSIKGNTTPIFSINKRNLEGSWTLNSFYPLLEFTEKLNIKCLWEVDYESFDESFAKYRNKLILFKHLLNRFDDKKENCKVVGGDLGQWLKSESPHKMKKMIYQIAKLTDAIMWKREIDEILILNETHKPLLMSKAPIWLVTLTSNEPITFKSAMIWAKAIGNTARAGYDAVFREIKFYELFEETPVFWVTLFHKKLMGGIVLEIESSDLSNFTIYCHCTKMQNNSFKNGAVTVLAVNDDTMEHHILLKLPTYSLKRTEVQSYILTSKSDNSSSTYLNYKKLDANDLFENNRSFRPVIEIINYDNYLTLTVPTKSIAFFVLSDAHIPACINNENDNSVITKQNIGKKNKRNYQSKIKFEIQEDASMMSGGNLEVNESYYNNMKNNYNAKDRRAILEIRDTKTNDAFEVTANGTVQPRSKKERDFKKNENKLSTKVCGKKKIQVKCRPTDLEKDKEISKLSRREIREAKIGGRGRSSHGTSKKKKISILPMNIIRIKKSRRAINMALLQQKTEEVADKTTEKVFLMENQEFRNRASITQPKYLYKKQQTTEKYKLDIKKMFEELSKRNNYTAANSGSKSKTETESLHKSEVGPEESVDLDYLYGNDYDDIIDENRKNDEDFDEANEFNQNIKFPIRPTFRVKNKQLGSNQKGPKDIGAWLNREIIIDNTEHVQETIRNLEGYLNEKNDYSTNSEDFPTLDYYDSLDYNDYYTAPFRSKRDESHQYTEEDIIYYKQLMNSNIRHMRENIRKQKLKSLSRQEVKPVSLLQKFRQQKPVDKSPFKPMLYPMKHQVNEGQSMQGDVKKIGRVRFFKKNLFEQDTAEDFQGPLKQHKIKIVSNRSFKKPEEIDNETIDIIRAIKTELRNPRSIPIKSLEDKMSQRKTDKYMLQLPSKSERKKQDLLDFTAEDSPSVISYDEDEKDIYLTQNWHSLEEGEQHYLIRSKRYIDKNIAHSTNSLNVSINEIIKNADYLTSNFEDIQMSLILPEKEDIFSTDIPNATNITINHFTVENVPENTINNSLTDHEMTVKTTEESQDTTIIMVNTSIGNETRKTSKSSAKPSDVQKSSQIAKVYFLDNFFKVISNFVNNIHDKIKYYLM